MTDIVERLRAPAYWMSGSDEGHEGENDAPYDAADEIGQNRVDLEEYRRDVERLRAALEEAIEFVDQAEMALTPRGEAYVARWRAAIDGQSAPSGWRPIETAPKDGTAVLMVFVFEDGETLHRVVRWDGSEMWPWRDEYTGYREGEAKGWMPLPPAPGKEEV